MLHLAAGVYDIQHFLQGENIEGEDVKSMDVVGEKYIANAGFPSTTLEMDLQNSPGDETERVANLMKEVSALDGHGVATEEKSDLFTGKVQQLITMDYTKLDNSERARGEVKEAHRFPMDPHLLQDSHLHPHQSFRRSSSPESQMSDLNRSFNSTPSLGDSPTEIKDEPMFEGEVHSRLSVGSRTFKSHHESVMTDSGIYEHDNLECDGSDVFAHSDDRRIFAENVSERLSKALENASVQEREVETVNICDKNNSDNLIGSQNVQNDIVQKQHEDKFSSELNQKIVSSLDRSDSFNLSWFDSSSNDFYISSAVKGVGDPFNEFDPQKQTGALSNSQSNSQDHGTPTDRRKKMVMYIEGLKRKPNSDSSVNVDEDELAAYIYDPQINDSYNSCTMKTEEFFLDPFDELLRKIDRDEKEVLDDPFEDPDFAMPSPSSPVIIPPDYERDDGEFFMEVMSPFGDVSSMKINYKFEMQDATWGVSSEEAYFDLLTGERILSTIYEFEVSSEEDTDSVRMAESRHGHRDEGVTAFRQDSLEEDDVFSQCTESLDEESVIEETDGRWTVKPGEKTKQLLTAEGEKNKDELDESMDSDIVNISTNMSGNDEELSKTSPSRRENIENHSGVLENMDDADVTDFKGAPVIKAQSRSETKCEVAKESAVENIHMHQSDMESEVNSEVVLSEVKDSSTLYEQETSKTKVQSACEAKHEVAEVCDLDKVQFNQSDMDGEVDSKVPSDEVHDTLTPNETETDEVEDVDESITEISGDSDAGNSMHVYCTNEETPDIIVTTAEDEYNSEEEFFATDNFITIREQYICNATAACTADTCSCHSGRSDDDEDLLSIPHTEIEIISDTEYEFAANASGAESDGTNSVTEYDFNNYGIENYDTENASNAEGDTDYGINAGSVLNNNGVNVQENELINEEINEDSRYRAHNHGESSYLKDKDVTNIFDEFESEDASAANTEIITVNSINLEKLDTDDPGNVVCDNYTETGMHINKDVIVKSKARYETVETSASETESLSVNLSKLRVEDEMNDISEIDYSVDSSDMKVHQTVDDKAIDGSRKESDVGINDKVGVPNEKSVYTKNASIMKDCMKEKIDSVIKDNETDRNTVARDISFNNTEALLLVTSNTDAPVTSSVSIDRTTDMLSNSVEFSSKNTHPNSDIRKSDLYGAVGNDPESDENLLHLKKDNYPLRPNRNIGFKANKSATVEKVTSLEEEVVKKLSLTDKYVEPSSLCKCEEQYHVTNETETINETAETLILPEGSRPVNVCCDHLITQENVLNDADFMPEYCKSSGIKETEWKTGRTTQVRRLSFTKTTALIEEECERIKVHIGSKHKISDENEDESSVKYRRNNESVSEKVHKEETSESPQIEEELEICVPAAPPSRTKRLLLRRFSSEPKTRDQIRTNPWLTDFLKSHTIDLDLIQPPLRPKRKKETQMTPMTPPRKNRSVSRIKSMSETYIENAVPRRALAGAAENEKQSGENLKDGVGAGDSRSSSEGVETNGETQGKRAGTRPDPRDPGTKTFGMNINQPIHEKTFSCDARLHHNTTYESHELCEEDSTRSTGVKKDTGFVFTRPIKVSEIVASLVLESPKFSRSKPPKIKSYITSRRSFENQQESNKENENDELKEVTDEVATERKILQVSTSENNNDTHVMQGDDVNNEMLNVNEGNASCDETWSPRPPERKKKMTTLICNANHLHLVDAANEMTTANGMTDKLSPPKVPERTYRRTQSLPRRPKTRRGPSPYYSHGGGKAVTRSATTATCRPHNTPSDLRFSVPEITSVINYDPLVKNHQGHRRASVTLLDEPESPEAIKRHLAFQKGVAPTPHIRKRHTADLPNSEWKSLNIPKRKSSIKRISSFTLPRTLVKKLTNQSSSDTTNCFPNPFSRKHKDDDGVYFPHKAASSSRAAKSIFRSTSMGSKDTFSELFSNNSSLDCYDSNQDNETLEKKSSIFDDDNDTNVNNQESLPFVPPRKNKKKELSFTLPKEQENDETSESKDTEIKGDNENPSEESAFEEQTHLVVEKDVSQDRENNEAIELADEKTKDDESSTNEEEDVKTPLYLKTYYLKGFREEAEEKSNDNESGKETDNETSHAKRLTQSWKIDEINEGNILDDSGVDLAPEDFTGKLLLPPHVASPICESLSEDEFRRLEKEVNVDYEKTHSPNENSEVGVESETPNTEVIELETHPWEPPVVPLQTWAERQGYEEADFPSLNLRHQSTQTQNKTTRRTYESAEKYTQYTPSPGPPVESEKDEGHHQQQEKSSKRDDDTRVQQDRCLEVYPETVRQRQRTMMSSSNKVDIKNWASGNGNDTLTSPAKVKKFLPSVKALRNQFETGKTNNNKPETNSSGVINNGTLSRKSSTSNSSITSSTLEKTSSTNSLNSTNGSTENLNISNIENSRPVDPEEPVEPIYRQFKKVDEELKELMSKPPSTTGWNPRPLLKRLYYVPEAPKHQSQGTTYINIEGYLEKLPSGRKKATFWNAWKRRYFVAKDGVLYYYQNPQADKASMKMTLMGGKVECMEPSMVGIDDGSRDSKAGAMIGIDDGKGHYVVVRCSSRQEAERWRRALETHTVEDFASQYVQPWPIPTNPALLRDTLVIDLGSSSVRAGVLATQATLPQVFLPSVVATERESRRQIWGYDALAPDVRSVSSVAFPVRPSHKISKYSVDLSAVSSLLQKAFTDLKVDPKNYNIQLSVPRILNPNTQTELLRILFDKYGVKSVNLTHQSILALYAYNATSGIVVDIGERMDIVPVIDGYIVDGGVSRVPYGGYRILDHLRQFLYMRNISLINEVESYIIRYVLENICYCAHHYNTEKARCTNNPDNFEKGVSLSEFFQGKDTPFECISLDFGRFQATEGLFNPDAWGLDHPGIHKLVHKAIMECSMDIRKEMSRSIFLAGGVTQLPGLVDRLTTEIDNLTPPAIRPKVHASPYRYHAAYIGACVLAESPAFTQSRITREEWIKQGSSALRKWSL